MAMIRLQMFIYPDEDVGQSGARVNNVEVEAMENNILCFDVLEAHHSYSNVYK